ncbi:MAG: 6-aminohexanoate-dimer hydrolase [Cypionkella sp.]|nr:6-aminohexanoate-dimer hydrolase [Cypionkella sp.]
MDSYKNSDPRPPIMLGSPPPPDMRPPMIDWDRAGWNRWSFQHVREILPTAAIRRADVASPLPEATGSLFDLSYRGANGVATDFGEMLNDTYTDAILVWADGKIQHESYHNGMDARSVHLLQSVSKSLTSSAAGSLVAEGLLRPEVLVTDYLPELASTGWQGATLQHVLDMTSGTTFSENYTEPDSDVGKMDYAAGWKPAPKGFDASDWPTCIWEQIVSLKVASVAHGTRFAYRSIETDVLAHAMERVTGQRLPQILSERLWQPLGCAEDASITLDRSGYGLACGGISATLRDLARFGLALLDNGKFNGRQVIPAAWCQDIRHGSHGLFDAHNDRNWPEGSYRNQFWIENSALGRHYCFGVFGQMIMIAPDTGTMIVKLSSWPDFVDSELYRATMAGLSAVEQTFAR